MTSLKTRKRWWTEEEEGERLRQKTAAAKAG
jgi:hypothetical protein